VHGQHKQGGWSQARYQRSVDEDVQDHLRNVADAAFAHFKRAPFDNLLLGGPSETLTDFESKLHAYLQERVKGRIDVDVENTNADEVYEAAAAKIAEHERRREREALDRLREGLSTGGRAAAGLEDVLEALNERRVETLLLTPGLQAPGCTCPQCGWVGPLDGGACPADGTEVDCRSSVVESAVELAVVQSASVLVLRDEDHQRELQSHGEIAAVLRF
jgi:peptide subunit release factor 1 (eRF1)